jgi:hypothetical protein
MGAFQGERHIGLHISPTTCSFCPIPLAMIFIRCKDFKTLKITQFDALAGQIQHTAAQKSLSLLRWLVRYSIWLLKNRSVWCSGWSDTAHPFSKIGFTPRLLRQVALTCPFQAQLH